MGFSASFSSLTMLWLMLAAGVGVVSLPAVQPYSGPDDDCQCVPYNHFCSLEILPLTVVGAYSFAPYICPLRTRLCCLETPQELNQIDYEEPLVLANTDSLFFKDPASQFHRARQLRYNSDVDVMDDNPGTIPNEELRLEEDWYKHKAHKVGNMVEDATLLEAQEVEGQSFNTTVDQENVYDKEKQISEKYDYDALGNSVIFEDSASHTATETDETSPGPSEEAIMYYITLMQESSHMTERHVAIIPEETEDETRAVMGVHGTSQVTTDTSQTPTEEDTAEGTDESKVVKEEEKYHTGTENVGTSHASNEGGTSPQVAMKDNTSTLTTTVDPVDAMQSFHNESKELNYGAERSPTVKGNNGSVLQAFSTTENNISRATASSQEGSDAIMDIDDNTRNFFDGSLTISDVKESHSEQSFPEDYYSTSVLSNSRTPQIPPKATGNESATQFIYDFTVTPDPSVTDKKVDYAKIIEFAEAIISQNHQKLSDLQHSVAATQPTQTATVTRDMVDGDEKPVERYSDLHKQLSVQGLDGVHSEPVSMVSQAENLHLSHEKSRDPTFGHEQVSFTQLDHSNNCSRSQCGNKSLPQEPDVINQTFLPVNLSSASHPDAEILSYLENYTSEELSESSMVSAAQTAADTIFGSDPTVPSSSTDEPALWYWFFA